MKGTAIGLGLGSFLCFYKSLEILPAGDINGFVYIGIGAVFLYLAKLAWGKTLEDTED